FMVTYQKPNYLNWTKYEFSKVDGIATPKLSGSINAPIDGSTFVNHETFSTIDGQHAIVYLISYGGFMISSEYPRFAIYVHFVKDNSNQQSNQILLYKTLDSMITIFNLIECKAGFNSPTLHSNICIFHYVALNRTHAVTKQVVRFIKFLSTGSTIQEDVLSVKVMNVYNISYENPKVIPLQYGGVVIFNDTSILNNYKSVQVEMSDLNVTSNRQKLFEATDVALVKYNVLNNNTAWFVYGNNSHDRKLIAIDVERIYNDCEFESFFGYENPAILSSHPTLNMTIPLSFNDRINITFSTLIVPSSGNISIYQMINQDTFLMRQTYSAFSNCEIYNNVTLSCLCLSSTFSRINSIYIIVADNNFVKDSSFNEPLRGIKRDIWRVMTPK
ncbi:8770_t:CDS:2, partial [Cetraspora pellucida]